MRVFFDFYDNFKEEINGRLRSELLDWVEERSKETAVDELMALIDKDKEEKPEETERLEREKNDAIDKCIKAYHEGMSLYPSEEEIRSLGNRVASAKRSFIDGIQDLRGISQLSKKILVPRLESIHFTLPFSKNQFTQKLNRHLDDAIEAGRATGQNRDDFMEQPSVLFTVLVGNAKFSSGEEEDDDDETDGPIVKICQDLRQSAFNNATWLGLSSIRVAYTMAKRPSP